MYDYVIIGGGIVGLSTAWQLKQRKPASRILLLEKEAQVALVITYGLCYSSLLFKDIN